MSVGLRSLHDNSVLTDRWWDRRWRWDMRAGRMIAGLVGYVRGANDDAFGAGIRVRSDGMATANALLMRSDAICSLVLIRI